MYMDRTYRETASSYPMLQPVESELFLPPASCKHKRGDDAFVKSQNADRERMVCAVGLDVHYELNVVAQDTGSYTPRLKPFNPRMSGPACPYNYTGKFLPEYEQGGMCEDPIALGKKIAAVPAYDTALYRKHDPRLVSKTVVIRDYGCKIPIELADTEKVAKAVLNNYPDQYVAFLTEFASNVFGANMRTFLQVKRDAFQKLLEVPNELNRISWAAYRSVQGGKVAPSVDETTAKVVRLSDYMYDCTLTWNDMLNKSLNETAKTGDTMAGNLSAQDLYDLRPCLRQHIETLNDMIEWCRGFGTKERYALAMVFYCNDQGRNMVQDLQLLKDADQPNYNKVTLHVPTNFYWMTPSDASTKTLQPDENCKITKELTEVGNTVQETRSITFPVGSWTGSAETGNVFVGVASRSVYNWGWGHPANLTINVPAGGTKSKMSMCAPFLRYTVDDPGMTVAPGNTVTYHLHEIKAGGESNIEYVNAARWGSAYSGTVNGGVRTQTEEIIRPAEKRGQVSVRDSLAVDDDDRRSFVSSYRGASSHTGPATYREAVSTSAFKIYNVHTATQSYRDPTDLAYSHDPSAIANYPDAKVKERTAASKGKQTLFELCKEGISPVNLSFSPSCKHLDPFFTNGDHCFTFSYADGRGASDHMLVDPRIFGFYDLSKMGASAHFREVFTKAIGKRLEILRYPTAPSSFAANLASTPADLVRSYTRQNQVYPFRTVVPPMMRRERAPDLNQDIVDHRLPVLNLCDPVRLESIMKRYASGSCFDSTSVPANVRNQPHIISQVADMSNIVWDSTPKQVDLSFSDVRTMPGHGYMKYVMQIIALRSILSTSLGMDVAALVCESTLPSKRIVVGPGISDTSLQAETYEGGDFVTRTIPDDLGLSKDEKDNLANWSKGIWSQEFSAIQTVSVKGRVVFTRKSDGEELSEEAAATEVYKKMAITMSFKLGMLLKLAEDKKTDNVYAKELVKEDIGKTKAQLRASSYDYLLRLALLQFKDGDKVEQLEEGDEFPYDLAFHGRVGSPFHPSLKTNRDESILRDPRAFYAFNYKEYKAQKAKENEHFGKKNVVDFFPTNADIANLEKKVKDLLTRQTVPSEMSKFEIEGFNESCDEYITHVAEHVKKVTKKNFKIMVILQDFLRLNNPLYKNTELIFKGANDTVYRSAAALTPEQRLSYNFLKNMTTEVTQVELNKYQAKLTSGETVDIEFNGENDERASVKNEESTTPSAAFTTFVKELEEAYVKSGVQNAADKAVINRRGLATLTKQTGLKEMKNDLQAFTNPVIRSLDIFADVDTPALPSDTADAINFNEQETDFGAYEEELELGKALSESEVAAAMAKEKVKKLTNEVYELRERVEELTRKGSVREVLLEIEEMKKDREDKLAKAAKDEADAAAAEADAAAALERVRAKSEKLRIMRERTQAMRKEARTAKITAALIAGSNAPNVKFPVSAVVKNSGGFEGYLPIAPTKSSADKISATTPRIGAAGITDEMKMLPVGPCALKGTTINGMPKFSFIPVGKQYAEDPDKLTNADTLEGAVYNTDVTHPQMFAMLDASGLLWHARAFKNPADCNRPVFTEVGQVDNMHYWCRTMVESFVYARETYREKHPQTPWEASVKFNPQLAFPSSMIGAMCDESWHDAFPLLPYDHPMRKDLKRMRALNILWGVLPTYTPSGDQIGTTGAWMPLSVSHQMKLFNTVGLYDEKYRIPHNPWPAHNGHGLSLIFNQSYHSVYHTDSWRAPHFQSWLSDACRYQPPYTKDKEGCSYPFSQYGGTPVEGDFVPHIVEKPEEESKIPRHRQLVYNRFGFTSPLRIGQQYDDTGMLQDLFQFKYRAYANLTMEQRSMPEAKTVMISNFMAYARTHAIIALASNNHGTEALSVPRTVRNLYRLYVDTYECMGSNPDDDGVPVIMGFLPTAINKKEDRAVTLFAGSLACLNTKLERFCASSRNKGEGVCKLYKQVYLNDATLLYTRMLRQERRKMLHANNYNRALMKRGPNYTRREFDRDLVDLQDAYIEFLQTTILGMLMDSGADLSGAPLHLLEPRELEVSMYEEDDNVVGNDFLTPRTREIIATSDFGGDNLTRQQLAILSLIPPNHRILGTLRLNQSTEIIDLEHAKKQIQKETIASNKKVWERYSEALVSAAFAHKLLEVEGPMDFSLDMSSVQDPGKFSMKMFKDPLHEAESLPKRVMATHAQASSSLSQTERARKMRLNTGPDSVLAMNTGDFNRALDAVRARVEREYKKKNGSITRGQCLELLRRDPKAEVPLSIVRILKQEYENVAPGTA